MEIISKSENETCQLAQKVAAGLAPGETVALYGDLGSGKTTFTKGLAKHLGIEKAITSPTFVIMKEYVVPENPRGIVKLIHIDCYRMQTADDAESIGIHECLDSKNDVTILEWPENISLILTQYQVKKINFKYIDETTRKITIE